MDNESRSENKNENNTEKLFDAILKVAAEDATKQEACGLPTQEELKSLYNDSDAQDFYKNMLNKIDADMATPPNAKPKQLKNKLYRFAASVAIVFMVSLIGLMSVEASRNFIISRVIEMYDNRVYIRYQFGDLSDFEFGPLHFGYLPEGFTLYSRRPFLHSWNYNFIDGDGELSLFVQYFAIEDMGGLYSTHDLHPNYEFYIIPFQGHVAYISESIYDTGLNSISWIYGRNSILIWSWVDIEELIKIAENITVLPNNSANR